MRQTADFVAADRVTGTMFVVGRRDGRESSRKGCRVRPAGARLQALDRQILHLAVPALGALVAEPLFLVADSLIVGRLGTAPLAGLGIAGSLLATTVGLFIFLAFGATATVARRS